MVKLRKSDMASRVATKLGGSRAQGEDALNAVLESVKEAISNGNKVVLTGFGSFEVRSVKARMVRPIRGGAPKEVPEHRRVGFTAGAELTRAVKNS